MKKLIIPIMVLCSCTVNAYASPTAYRQPYYTPSSMTQKAIRRTPQQNRTPYRGYAVNPKTPTPQPTKWYIDFGFGVGFASADASFDARDWCNSAGCVKDYWETFSYPGSRQKRKLGDPTPFFGSLKFARKYDKFAWGVYGDAGNPASALGMYAEFGNQWLFELGVGFGHNSIFDKSAVDIRFGLGYGFELTEQWSLVAMAFFDGQITENGKAEGEGYLDENGTACYNCWASGFEMLTYYSGGIKATLRHKF